MHKLYKSVFFLIITSLYFPIAGYSTHIVGGSLSYKAGAANSYTVTLKLYRDCCPTCATLASSYDVNILNTDGSSYSTPTVTTNSVSITNIAATLPPCASAPASPPCVQEYVYQGVITLPKNPGGYHLYFSLCCRNTTLTNTNAADQTQPQDGETFYAYIPGYQHEWIEGFAGLADGTTSDAGATAWTRTLGSTPPASAQVTAEQFEVTGANAGANIWLEDFGAPLVNGDITDAGTTAWTRTMGTTPTFSASVQSGQFEVTGANNGSMTWTSQVINIASYTSGVNLKMNLSEAGTLDPGDSIVVSYSLNGATPVRWPINGKIADDFTSAVAEASDLTGNTVQIFVKVYFDAISPNSQIYRIDNVLVYPPASVEWASQVINIASYTSGVNMSVNLSEAGTLDPNDNIKVEYSLNSGARVTFPTNGSLFDDFTSAVATATVSPGSTVQLFITVTYDVVSPSTQIYRWDKVSVYDNSFFSNSSPVFGSPPPLYLCAVNTFTINYSATDTEGDSLAYSLYAPYSDIPITFPNNTATFTPIIWVPGYSATSPFNSGGPGITLNSTTGTLTGVANSLGRYVFGVKCSEYRNGVLLSQVVRDFQANVVTCPPFVPTTPTAGTGNPNPICTGQTLSLTANSADVGVTYSWSGPNGFTSTAQNPIIANVTTLASGTYSVTGVVTGCNSLSGTVTITVNPTPATPVVSSNSPVCSGSTLSLTATATGSTYSWTGPNSFTAVSQNPTIANVTTLASGTYSVKAVSGVGCIGTSSTTTVTVNQTPPAPAAASNSAVCSGNTLSLTASTIVGATYSWTGPNSFTSVSQNPTIPNVTSLASGSYSVTASAGGCTGPAGTTSVTVKQTPSASTAGSNTPVCSGNTLSLTASTISGATYSWTGPNSFSSASQNPTIPTVTTLATGSYSVSASAGGCSSSAGTASVTINPTPAVPTAGSNSPLCIGSTLSLTSSSTGTTYSWNGPNSFTSILQNPTLAGVTTLAAGTYSVTASANGCTSAAGSTSVTVAPPPATPTTASNSPVCTGNSLSLTATTVAGAIYSWTGPNSFSSASKNPVITGITTANAGTYSVTATVGGCTGSAGTISVTINPPPPAPAAGNNTPVCSGSTLSLTAGAVSGATGYNWTGPNGFSAFTQNPTIGNATTLASGTYSVTATVPGCATSPAGVTSVLINQTPAAPSAGSNSTVCAGQTLSLTASNSGSSYSWTGPNGFTSGFQNPTIINATTAASGTYSVTATSAGCTGVAGTTSVTVSPIPGAPTVSSNTPLCSGNTLSLTATAIGGATYSWSGPNSFSSASQNPTIPNATTLASGTYSVTASVGGCAGTAGTTSITINPTPASPTAGSNGPLCAGNTLSLTASSAGTYSWNGPNGFSSALQNPVILAATTAASGTYSVTTAANGCTSPAGTVSVTVNPPPSAPTAGSNAPVCAGVSLSLTASNVTGASYSWVGPNGFSSILQNPVIVNVTTLASGTYSVTATVAGCPPLSTVTTSVTINSTPSAPTTGSNSPVCVGGTISLTATGTGTTYSWSGPSGFSSASQNPVITGAGTVNAGTYSVTTSSAAGCTSTGAIINITVNPPPGAPSAGSNTPVCSGNTLSLTANTVASAAYSWTGPNGFSAATQNPTIASVTSLVSGTYSVTVTVPGCVVSPAGITSVNVNLTPAAPSAGNNSPICTGTTLSLTASTIGSSTYSWRGPNGFSSSSQNPTIPGATTLASGIYSVTATENGCTGLAGTSAVTVSPPPATPVTGSNSPVCTGNTLSLTAGTIAGATYSWAGPNGFSSALQNPTIPGVTTANAGTYSVTASVTGCAGSTGTINVIVNPPPSAPAAGSNTPVCSGNTLSLTASAITGATNYNWTGPNGFSSPTQDPSIGNATTLASGTYSVTATVPGCPVSPAGITAVIVNQTPAAPAAGGNSPACVGNSLSLTASNTGSTYNWNGPNSFTSASQNPIINGLSTANAGTYTVYTISASGCTSTNATVNIVINPPPSAPAAGSNSPVCSGTTLSLTASNISGVSLYSWTGPNSFSAAIQNTAIGNVTTLASGTYSVTATVPGCPLSPAGIMSVTVNQTPAAPAAGSNSPVCSGNNLSLTASAAGGSTYSWSGPNSFFSASQNPLLAAATSANAGTYSVTATENGCTGPAGTTSVTVNPIPLAPNAGSNSPLCIGNTLSLTAGTISGAVYSWTGPNGFSSASQNPVISNVSTAEAGTYSVSATVLGCTGSMGTVSVSIAPPPAAPVAGNISPVCSGTSLSLTASTIAGATSYNWSGPNSFSSSIQNPTIPSVTTLASGIYSVSATVAGCTGPAGTTSVTINQTPAAPLTSNNGPLCTGDNLSLTAGTIFGATYLWAGPNSFSSASQNPVINSASTAEAGIYSVIATVNGCTGPAGSTTVIVSPPPATPVTGSNSPVCSGTSLSLTSTTFIGATYSWSGPNGFSSPLQNPIVGSVTTLASGAYSLFVKIGSCTSPTATVSVIVKSTPAAPVANNNSPICSGSDLSLTASTVGVSTYSWSGPNSFSSASQNPVLSTITSSNAGTYSVTATENGCTGPAGTTSVTVNPIPTAPNAGSNSPLCVGNTLSLTASTMPGAAYSWTGPNGFSSASQNPVISNVSTADAGMYSVSATVLGCTGSIGTVSVSIAPPPAAPVAGNTSPVCSGTILSLTASSIAGATSYNWSGPNSFSSSIQNPAIPGVTTLASGIYSVSATVAGCTGPAGTTSVTINQTPAAPLASNNGPLCTGDNLSLTAGSISGATYLWAGPNSFSSASQNPVINSASTAEAGAYSVIATVNGCTGPAGSTTVIVSPPPATPVTGSNSPVCSGTSLSLTSTTFIGATYSWSGPNGFSSALQNPVTGSISTLASGTYSLFVMIGSCTSPTGTVSVIVKSTPAAPVTNNNSPICSGSDLSLTASTVGGSTYLWTGPNSFSSASQNPVILIATTANGGTYSVTATENGCTGPAGTTSVTVNPIPAAPNAGSNSPLCVGNTLSLTASTMPGAAYSWTGPNGFSSASQNPVISNVSTAEAGMYSVSATVLGCTGSIGTVSVSIAPPPAAPVAGNTSPVCSGTSLSLTASTIAGATSYNWSGPNSFSSSIQNPAIANVTTLASGIYSVSATVAGCAGPAGTTSVTINQTPAAPLTSNNGPLCIGDNLSLTAGTISGATYLWTGPNSFSSASQNPVINNSSTAEAGIYSVIATANGCTGPAGSTTVIVSPPPTTPITGSNSPVCSGTVLSLTSTTFIGATYSWSGPNGFSSALQNPVTGSISTLASGTYSLFVMIGSCTSPTATVSVIVNQTPPAPVGNNNSPMCSGNDLSLTASTVGSSTYSWTGPNSFSSASQNPVILAATTANTGIYSVTATENGCTSPAGTTSVTIHGIPSAPATGNNGPLCLGDNLSLTANTVAGGTYSWSGPNGFSSALQNPVINNVSTAEAGTYSVSVSVSGCPGAAGTTSVIVAPPPSAPVAGGNSPVCSGTTLSLTANTTLGATYSWNGPAGFSSALQNPLLAGMALSNAGTYSVIVKIGSCTSPAGTVSITVNPSPAAPAASSNSPLCLGDNLSLNASTIAGTTYSWNGPNSFSSSLQNPMIANVTTAEAGSYSVSVTSIANGCTSSIGAATVVINTPPAAPIAGSNSPICSGYVLSLTASTAGSVTYNWNGPNNFSASTQNPVIGNVNSLAAGTYSVTATAPGCPTSPAGTVSVSVKPTPAAPVAGNSGPACSGSNLSLTASTVGGSTYSWTGPNSFSSASQNPVITASTTANTGIYSVTATENGCTSPAGTTSVTIHAIPSAPNAGNNGPLCLGDNLSLTANTIAGATYSWNGPNGFSSTSQNPVINAVSTAKAGTYSVSVSVAGCPGAVGTTSVIVAPPPSTPLAGSNSPVCSGLDLSLTATNSVSGAIYSWTGPDSFSAASQNPVIAGIPTSGAGTYAVIVKIGSCTSPAGTVSVTVNPSPVAPVIGSNSPLCTGNTLSLTASTIAGVTYSWSGPNGFSSALQNPVINNVTTAEAGTYSVSVASVANGCISTSSQTVSVTFPASVNAGTDQTVCANNAALLNGTITGGSGTCLWSTPNGTGVFAPNATALNATYTPGINDTLAGNILLVLSSTNNGGCSPAKDTVMIHVNRGPVVNAGPDQSICSNNYSTVAISGSVQFAAGGIWSSLGTGSFQSANTILNNTYMPSPADSANGSVMLILSSTGNGSCSAVTDSMRIHFTPAPLVNAGTDVHLCIGDTSASLKGTVSGGAATGQWSTLGSGTFSPNNAALNATYFLSSADTAAGSVTLVLHSTNFGNCKAVSDTVIVSMAPAPLVAAGPDVTVCANNSIVSLHGNVSGGSTTGYWSSGGTGKFIPDSSALNATYISSAADTAAGHVTLILTSTNGCRQVRDSLKVTLTPAPVVNAGANITVCKGTNIVLNGSINSAATGGQWTTSGNGTFIPNNLTLNASYIPGSKDTALVTLVLTSTGNGQCLAVSDTLKISIEKNPIAGFIVPHICTGQSITFTDVSSAGGANNTIAAWNWTILGGTYTVQNPSYTYTLPGTDTVKLVITTAAGCRDTATHFVHINPVPVAAFTALATCSLDSVYFTSASSIASGKIVSWSWDFGDTKTSSIENPVHYYASPGAYVVSLAVTSDSGCSAAFTRTIITARGPEAGFSFTTDCNFNTTFKDTSLVAAGDTVVSWSWNFGDGSPLNTTTHPAHTYTSVGTYTVTLHIVTKGGCIANVSHILALIPIPIADFVPPGGTYIIGQTVAFTDLSANAASWIWNFGDGNSDSIQNPSHTYNQNGTFNVMLIVSNTAGCPDTAHYSFLFNSNIVAIPTAFTPNGDNVNDVLFVRGGPLKEMDWRIYNEWGNEVFHSTSQAEGWDGRYKGKIQPEARYVFILKGTTYDNKAIELSGEVTILR